jgi:hypothetical protein
MGAEDEGDSSDDGRERKSESSMQAQNMRERAEWLASMEIEREQRKVLRLQKRRVQAVFRSAEEAKEQVRLRRASPGVGPARDSARLH